MPSLLYQLPGALLLPTQVQVQATGLPSSGGWGQWMAGSLQEVAQGREKPPRQGRASQADGSLRRLNMGAVTTCSDFGEQENKVCHYFHCFPIFCHEVMRPDVMILVF